ncbi:MAG: lysophospholipase [Candidatus Obscuribacterales bacterium]|nr:lysophospholipase [Candidatus Obscuribacterales bacterium]
MKPEINLTPTCSFFELNHKDGPITGRTWGTASDSPAIVLLVHGLGAHSGWFEAIGRRLKVRGLFAVSYDQVGFGKRASQEFQGYEQWLNDLEFVYNHLRYQHKDKPIFIMGNSMGGVVAMAGGPKLNPQGIILVAPGFDGYPETFKLGFRLKAMATALLSPNSLVDLPYRSDLVAREESARTFMDTDPDGRFSLPAKMLLGLLKLTIYSGKNAKSSPAPVLMLTAGVDRIVNNEVSTKVFDSLIAPAKKRRHFKEAWHDLLFDPVIDEVADEVTSFVNANLTQSAVST